MYKVWLSNAREHTGFSRGITSQRTTPPEKAILGARVAHLWLRRPPSLLLPCVDILRCCHRILTCNVTLLQSTRQMLRGRGLRRLREVKVAPHSTDVHAGFRLQTEGSHLKLCVNSVARSQASAVTSTLAGVPQAVITDGRASALPC